MADLDRIRAAPQQPLPLLVLMEKADSKEEFEHHGDKAFGRQRYLPMEGMKRLTSGEGI